MLRLWADLGYRKVITTPHVITATYPNTRETILGQLYLLRDRIAEEGLILSWKHQESIILIMSLLKD